MMLSKQSYYSLGRYYIAIKYSVYYYSLDPCTDLLLQQIDLLPQCELIAVLSLQQMF